MVSANEMITGLERWTALWHRLGAKSGAESVHRQLIDAYSEAHRAYHTLDHLRDCLAQFDAARLFAAHPDEVETGLWFHDAIYDTRSADNEERSARWAQEALRDAGAPEEVAVRVSDLVLATRHKVIPSGTDAGLLIDVDLSILGRAPEEFEKYERQIRQEYEWVPAPAYRQARANILQGFLEREFIYQTEFFRERYESQARENLKRSIRQLCT